MTDPLQFALGRPPAMDGDATLYFHDRRRNGLLFSPVLYVNGMNTEAASHRRAACQLSAIIDRPVLGIFKRHGTERQVLAHEVLAAAVDSKRLAPVARLMVRAEMYRLETAMFLRDLAESGLDKFQHDRLVTIVPAAGEWFRLVIDLTGWRPVAAVEFWLSLNPATLAVMRELKSGRVKQVVCHSQGCLIVRNALMALDLLKEKTVLSAIEVHALSQTAERWPSGIRLRSYAFCNDPIPSLTGGRVHVRRCDPAGMMPVHGIDLYLEQNAIQLRAQLGLGRK
jgi:hypothetical protein